MCTRSGITLTIAAGVLGVFLVHPAAQSQGYPSKPIRMIVPVLPGGAPDFAGRAVGQRLSDRLAQQVVVDNRPGAGGIIGLEALKASPPNGYTIAAVQMGPLTVNPHIYDKLSYDSLRDFTHITNLVKFPLLLVTHPSLPVRDVKELIALARARPGEITYSSSGAGGTVHTSAELFNMMSKVKMLRIQYKSIAPALVAVVSGETHLTFSNFPAALPLVRSGRLRVLGISSAKRSPFLPEIPTIAESGLPGYEAHGGVGVLGPANVPEDILGRLNREIVGILNMKEFVDVIVPQGMLPAPSTPEEFTAYLRSELKKWGEVVKVANIRLE